MSRLIVLFLMVIAAQPLLSQEGLVSIMSFNIRLPHPGDGIHYWDHRRPLVASVIRYHQPDIIGVQEAFRRQLDEMNTDMPEYSWFGVCRTDGSIQPEPDGEFSAILYRHDRFDRLDGGTFWLSATPDSTGSVGWDAALPRIVTWAEFRDKTSGKEFFHFNTHFDHMGQIAREESARVLIRQIASIARHAPVLVTGDFNTTEQSQPYAILTDTMADDHLEDAMYRSAVPHHGPMMTYVSDFLCPSEDNGYRIDYVFVAGAVSVLQHAILTDSWGGRMASDHMAVLAEVLIGGD